MAQADSLWSTQVQSPYSQPVRRFQNGDPVTIYIKETLQAAQEGKTSASKQSEVNGSLVDWFQQFATNLAGDEQIRRDREFTVGGGDDYKGEGKTSRRSEIKGIVAALVTGIKPNGNLTLYGQHQVKVNDEMETIQIRGEVRPQDISAENSIYSYQVADAEIAIKGAGVVSQKQSPGVMTRMLNWLF